MKINYLFVAVFSLILGACAYKSAVWLELPYLAKGGILYKDNTEYLISKNTSLKQVYINSRFYNLPDFKKAEHEKKVDYSRESSILVQGDGGFSGLIIEKGENYPNEVILTFPNIEGNKRIVAVRAINGWKVVSLANSPDQVVF